MFDSNQAPATDAMATLPPPPAPEAAPPAAVEFPAPKGFQPPATEDPSGEWEMVCSFKTKDGKICMTKLGDTPMPTYDKDEKAPESRPDYSAMGQQMMDARPMDQG